VAEAFLSRGAVLDRPNGAFSIRAFRLPPPDPGGIVVRLELAGMCGTDYHVYAGQWPDHPYPVLLGHENVGVVAALGDGVTVDYLGRPVAVGDRVVTILHRRATLQTTDGEHVHVFGGGYAEYIRQAAPDYTVLRTDLDPRTAMLLEPMSNSINGLERTPVRLGDTVVVQGCGGIGLPAVVVARLSGALRIIVVGGPGGRLELARACGADVCIDIAELPEPADRIRAVRQATWDGQGADVVIGATGIPATVIEAVEYLRVGGQLCEIGNATDNGEVAFSPYRHLVRKRATLAGVGGTGVPHFVTALRILERGGFPFRDMVSHQLPLERVGEGITALAGSYRIDGRDAIKIAVAPNGAPPAG
jgi:threonine dehydrogenase-like Zn-dependent dehydrogenase